jgi:hypothetical protein
MIRFMQNQAAHFNFQLPGSIMQVDAFISDSVTVYQLSPLSLVAVEQVRYKENDKRLNV